jgi:O-antigen ligase
MNLKYSNSVLINLIIVSIIPFLIWGPFFPDLIVSLSALFFLYYYLKIIIFIILAKNHLLYF